MENNRPRKPLLLFVPHPIPEEDLDIIIHAIWSEPEGSTIEIKQLNMTFMT